MRDDLGDRVKRYENAYRHHLTPRSCLFVRVDGQAFHTYAKGFRRPFDGRIMDAMSEAAARTASRMQGFRLGYTQSDEASFLLTDFETHETQGWFGYNLQKVVSIAASAFTAHFNDAMDAHPVLATFDARAFVVPPDDAPNVFVWRQRDWERNAIQMLARSAFPHKSLQGVPVPVVKSRLVAIGLDPDDLPARTRFGTFLTQDGVEIHRRLDYEGVRELCRL